MRPRARKDSQAAINAEVLKCPKKTVNPLIRIKNSVHAQPQYARKGWNLLLYAFSLRSLSCA